MPTATKPKTERSPAKRIELLLQACREIQYERPDEAMEYAREAQRVAKSAKLREREIHAMRMVGICLYAKHDFAGAYEVFQRTLPLYRKLGDASGTARALQNMGLALKGLGRYEEGLAAFRKAETILRSQGDEAILTPLLLNIGSTYAVLDQAAEALKAYVECLTIADRRDDNVMKARAIGNIADVYVDIGDDEKAIEWSHRSLELHRANKDMMGVGLTLGNLGRVYRATEQLDTALGYYTESLAVLSDLKDDDGKARAMLLLGQLYLAKRSYAQATEFAQRALEIFKITQDVDREVSCLVTLSEAAYKRKRANEARAHAKQAVTRAKHTDNYSRHIDIECLLAELAIQDEKWTIAVRHLRDAIALAEKHQVFRIACTAHNLLATVYERTGELDKALKHSRRAHEMHLRSEDRVHARHSQALQLRLDVERSEREHTVVRLQNERLHYELEARTRELNISAVSVAQKNDLIAFVESDVQRTLKAPPTTRTTLLQEILRRLDMYRRTGDDWRKLTDQLKDVHEGFLKALTEKCPSLTGSELKIASLLKLNLSSKEIANILTLGPQSVDIVRHRIRKKLGLAPSESLSTYLQKIG